MRRALIRPEWVPFSLARDLCNRLCTGFWFPPFSIFPITSPTRSPLRTRPSKAPAYFPGPLSFIPLDTPAPRVAPVDCVGLSSVIFFLFLTFPHRPPRTRTSPGPCSGLRPLFGCRAAGINPPHGFLLAGLAPVLCTAALAGRMQSLHFRGVGYDGHIPCLALLPLLLDYRALRGAGEKLPWHWLSTSASPLCSWKSAPPPISLLSFPDDV